MAYCMFKSFICDKTKEAIDEPMIIVRTQWGSTRWSTGFQWGPHRMNDGETRGIEEGVAFTESVNVRVYEDDSRRRSGRRRRHANRTFIGEFNIDSTHANAGVQSYRVAAHRAIYRILYDVTDNERMVEYEFNPVSLRCNDAQEARDEPYLVVNGIEVWSARRVRTDDTRSINIEPSITFDRRVIVDLFERDSAVSNRIGTFTIDEEMARRYAENHTETHTHVFAADRGFPGSARYTLSFRVARHSG